MWTVKYKKNNAFFWHKIKKVQSDGILMQTAKDDKGNIIPVQVFPAKSFLLKDGTRIEISLLEHIFQYSPERQETIDRENQQRQTMLQQEAEKQKIAKPDIQNINSKLKQRK